MTNDVLIRRGTSFTLADSGASGVFTLACGSGSGIQSNIFDLGNPHADDYEMFAEVCTAIAPTAGGSYDFYFAPCLNGRFPGGVSGINGSYLTGSTIDASLPSLNYLGSIIVTNATGVHRKSMVITPISQSGCLIMDNNTTTASIALSGLITLTPLIPQVQV